MVKYLDCRLIRQLRVNTFTERVKRQMVKAFRISYADYYMLYSNIAILNGPLNPGLNHAFWVEKSGIEAWGKSLAWGWNVLTIGVSCRAFQLQTFQPQEASTPDFWTLYLGMKCYCWKFHGWVYGWKVWGWKVWGWNIRGCSFWLNKTQKNWVQDRSKMFLRLLMLIMLPKLSGLVTNL